MARATAEQQKALEAQVAEVERQYRTALILQGLTTVFDPVAMMGPLGALLPLFLGTDKRRLADGMELARQELVTLRSRYLPWAIEGKRLPGNGTDYDRALFTTAARDIALRIQETSGEKFNQTIFALVRDTARDTVTTVKDYGRAAERGLEALGEALPDADERERFLRYAKWTAASVGGLLLMGVGAYAIRSLR